MSVRAGHKSEGGEGNATRPLCKGRRRGGRWRGGAGARGGRAKGVLKGREETKLQSSGKIHVRPGCCC